MKNLLLFSFLLVLFTLSTNVKAQTLTLIGAEASCDYGVVLKIEYDSPTSPQSVQLIVERKSGLGIWHQGFFGTPSSVLILGGVTEKVFEYCTNPPETANPPPADYRMKIKNTEDWVYFSL